LFSGIGFGLIYAPAIVSVGYYFGKKRSLAMGIAVSASGFGTVIFPPLMHWMIKAFFRHQYKPVLLVEAGIILTCAIFGTLMVGCSFYFVYWTHENVSFYRFLYRKNELKNAVNK
jgi:MFS family permease